MEQISNVKTLKDRLQTKLEKDRQQIEAVTEKQLKQLSENLKNIVNTELNTIEIGIKSKTEKIWSEVQNRLLKIETDMSSETDRIHSSVKKITWITKKRWIGTVLIGLSLSIGILVGSWGLMQYLYSQVQKNLVLLQEQKQTLNEIQQKTWGLTLSENKNGKFIILPKGATAQSGFKAGKQEALKLIQK